MTKEEKIKEAWGVYYNMFHKYIKKDGILSEMHLTNNQCNIFYNDENIEVVEKGSDYWYYRPKSLQGIEDNNGWIRIEGITNLPKTHLNCLAITKSGQKIICESRCEHFYCYKNKWLYKYNDLTHYQVIDMKENPLY